MKHYWINMEKSTMRKNFMETQFSRLDIDNKRINAVTPQDFDNQLS